MELRGETLTESEILLLCQVLLMSIEEELEMLHRRPLLFAHNDFIGNINEEIRLFNKLNNNIHYSNYKEIKGGYNPCDKYQQIQSQD